MQQLADGMEKPEQLGLSINSAFIYKLRGLLIGGIHSVQWHSRRLNCSVTFLHGPYFVDLCAGHIDLSTISRDLRVESPQDRVIYYSDLSHLLTRKNPSGSLSEIMEICEQIERK